MVIILGRTIFFAGIIIVFQHTNILLPYLVSPDIIISNTFLRKPVNKIKSTLLKINVISHFFKLSRLRPKAENQNQTQTSPALVMAYVAAYHYAWLYYIQMRQ
jgi:hypothetical protein